MTHSDSLEGRDVIPAERVATTGHMEDRVAEIAARLSGVTEGPWFVWDGHGYFGGGKDLCIGAGPAWLANMDHRTCDKRDLHHSAMEWQQEAKMFADGHTQCAPEGDATIISIAETCSLDETFTAEQIANANFIARAREDVPFLLAVVAYLNRANGDLERENWILRNPDAADCYPPDTNPAPPIPA